MEIEEKQQLKVCKFLCGFAIICISTSFSLAGFQSHAAGVTQGLADGVGLYLMLYFKVTK